MIVIFDDEINEENVASFCDELSNKIYGLKEGDVVDVFFSTNGGVNHLRAPLLNILIKYQDYMNFYINWQMCSNGFVLLMELLDNKVQVYMTKDFVYSMMHKTDAALHNNRSSSYDKLTNNHIKKYNNDLLKKFKKLGFTQEQIDTFNKGEDLVFTAEETLKLFPNITLLK